MSVKKTFRDLLKSNKIGKGMTERQINIISSAIEIFAEKGYGATTTSEIAKRAKVAEGTIFRYYRTKKELLLAIPGCLAEISFSQIFLDDVDEIFDKKYDKFEDFLRNIILNRKNFASENMPIIKVVFQEIPFHAELRQKLSDTVFSPAKDKFIKVIDRFKEKGQIIDIPSNSIVNLIVTSIMGYIFSRYIIMLELNWDEKEETDYLIQYIMNGIGKQGC